jgi:hypothetical protein
MEDSFDAIAMDGLATFGGRITKEQQNLLNLTGKDIVLIPDFQKTEWESYLRIAQKNNWYISTPVWPGGNGYNPGDRIKDIGESIKKNSLLGTIESVIAGSTKDYNYARVSLRLQAGGE